MMNGKRNDGITRQFQEIIMDQSNNKKMETVDDWEETRPPPEWLVDLGFRMDQVPAIHFVTHIK